MAVLTPPYVLQGGSHPAATFRLIQQAQMGSPTGVFAGGILPTTQGGGHGVCSPNDLVVTQNGTPNMSVNAAAGPAFIRGTESASQGVYGGYNDATLNLAVAASDPTNPRRDLVGFRVRDSFYSGASNDLALVVITGTAAAVPVDPTPPANFLVLYRIAVGAAVTTIVNANLTDLRTRAAALGGIVPCTSTTRPSGIALFPGLLIFELDTFKVMQYQSATTSWTPPWNLPWGHISYDSATGLGTGLSTVVADLLASTSTPWPANRLIRVTIQWDAGPVVNTASSEIYTQITTAANVVLRQIRTFNTSVSTKAMPGVVATARFTSTGANLAFKIRCLLAAGTGIAFAGVTDPISILVEDLGPSANPA